MFICLSLSIYIYIERERERERDIARSTTTSQNSVWGSTRADSCRPRASSRLLFRAATVSLRGRVSHPSRFRFELALSVPASAGSESVLCNGTTITTTTTNNNNNANDTNNDNNDNDNNDNDNHDNNNTDNNNNNNNDNSTTTDNYTNSHTDSIDEMWPERCRSFLKQPHVHSVNVFAGVLCRSLKDTFEHLPWSDEARQKRA